MAILLLAATTAPASSQLVNEAKYFAEEEAFLQSFDLSDSRTGLSLLGGLQGTSMILKVKDWAGQTIGVFKPTSGNTLHSAEIAAYRLCRRLELPVCAPTVPKTIESEQLDQFAQLLEGIEFTPQKGERHAGHLAMKERFRRAMLDRLANVDSMDGAFKSWINPLILYQPLGSLADLKKRD
ncbi:MAG: hypothetical protein COB53_04120, partial [Elusimicrobia bacterium]